MKARGGEIEMKGERGRKRERVERRRTYGIGKKTKLTKPNNVFPQSIPKL
jgi:hypothetical protein